MKQIKPLVCSPEAARIIGATLYVDPPDSFSARDCATVIIRAANHIGAKGEIPVLTHGRGAVWRWPVQPGARESRARG